MKFTNVAEAFNFYRNKTIEELEQRAQAINAEIDSNAEADIEALNIELRGIKEARENIELRSGNPGQGVNLLRPLGRINSQHLAASPAGESHAGQNLYSGCLSRPIGAQEAKDLPRIQPQSDAFERPLSTRIGF